MSTDQEVCFAAGRWFSASLLFVLLVLGCDSLTQAGNLSLNHQAKIAYDFAGMRIPEWSGGGLVNFVYNRTAAPLLLSFDAEGRQIQAFSLTIPDAAMIDLDDLARSPEGWLVACGTAYDSSGRGSGFIGIVSSNGDQLTTVRLFPYQAFRITVANDGTIWTAGLELVDAKETGPGVNLQ